MADREAERLKPRITQPSVPAIARTGSPACRRCAQHRHPLAAGEPGRDRRRARPHSPSTTTGRASSRSSAPTDADAGPGAVSISAETAPRPSPAHTAGGERHGHAHAERRVGVGGQREARRVGAGRAVGHGRKLAQPHRVGSARTRTSSTYGPGGSVDPAEQRLRHRDHRLAVADRRDVHDRLAERDHLSGLGVGLGDHAGASARRVA